jgi:hypothetical protein
VTNRLRRISLLCLAAAACAPAPAPPRPAPVEAAPSDTAPVPPVAEAAAPVRGYADVAGQWDVASFEGYAPERLSGANRAAYADFQPTGVSLRIECNSSGRAGVVRDGRFVPMPGDGIQTVMGCGREREARDSRYFSFFENSPTIERLGRDRLRLRAGGIELILERPALRRLGFVPTPAEIEGKWRMLGLTRFIPEGGYTGIGLTEIPGRIVIEGDRIGYSRCPQYDVTFRWGEGGRIEKIDGAAPQGNLRDCLELNGPASGYRLPDPADVLALLHAGPLVERTRRGELVLSTGELGLVLTREPCQSVEQSADHRTTRTVDCASPE